MPLSDVVLDMKMPFGAIRELAARSTFLVYAIHTPWWFIGEDLPYHKPGMYPLPCDPRGSMLLQTENPMLFIESAEANPSHYGRHGLIAFAAAYHGNVLAKPKMIPTSLDNWDAYNELLDRAGQKPQTTNQKQE